mgnify:CR=1 FL=1|jgi:hypothetical protein
MTKSKDKNSKDSKDYFVLDSDGQRYHMSPAYLMALIRDELERFYSESGNRCKPAEILRFNDLYSRSTKGKLSDS